MKTRFKELDIEDTGYSTWRFIDTSTGASVGAIMASKAEALAHLEQFARGFLGLHSVACQDAIEEARSNSELIAALAPFATFFEKFAQAPMNNTGDVVYAINGGSATRWGAEIKLSELRVAYEAMLKASNRITPNEPLQPSAEVVRLCEAMDRSGSGTLRFE